MKLIRIAGLCLAAVFAMSMVAVATSQAAKWERCASGAAGTKWESNQCTKVGGTNTFGWEEVTNTEKVVSVGETITLRDKKATGGSTAVQCWGATNEGSVGPGKYDRITEIKVLASNCRRLENTACESVVEVKAVHLPWQTELEETEGKILDIINNGGGGAGKEPGWAVTCKTLLGNKTDTCEGEGETKNELLMMENKLTNGTELLVLATFEKKRKAKCSEGGAEQGEVEGSTAILTASGAGLRVSK